MLLSSFIRAPFLADDRHSPVKSLNYRISLIRCRPQIEALLTEVAEQKYDQGDWLERLWSSWLSARSMEKIFWPIVFLAGRERSCSMSLQFIYHFHSSPTGPFSISTTSKSDVSTREPRVLKAFGSGNYEIRFQVKNWGTKAYIHSLSLALTLTVILSPNHFTTSNFKWPCKLFCLMCTVQTSCMCHTTLCMCGTT